MPTATASRSATSIRTARRNSRAVRQVLASMAMHSSLKGRVVIVPGASRGLGRAMALGLARVGARVAVVASGTSAPLDETMRQLAAVTGAQAISALGDLREPASCERMAAEVL